MAWSVGFYTHFAFLYARCDLSMVAHFVVITFDNPNDAFNGG